METMVSGRINGSELMVSTQEIMVSGGPGIRLHEHVSCAQYAIEIRVT